MACGDPTTRRGILRALTTLPLVGGSVALIGAPSAVAETPTYELLLNYETWLAIESNRIARELRPGSSYIATTFGTPAFRWHDAEYDLNRPSTRAALVLSAVGCDWRH